MEKLMKWKKIVTRLDMVGIVATIVYYYNVVQNFGDEIFGGMGFNYFQAVQILAENTSLLGVLLLTFSAATFIAIIYITVEEQVRGKIGELKAVATISWNGIWTIGELAMLHMVLFG